MRFFEAQLLAANTYQARVCTPGCLGLSIQATICLVTLPADIASSDLGKLLNASVVRKLECSLTRMAALRESDDEDYEQRNEHIDQQNRLTHLAYSLQ